MTSRRRDGRPGRGDSASGPGHRRALVCVGLLAVTSSTLYLLSDVVEVLQDGFSPGQLRLTLIAEAAVPPVVLGLAAVQRPRLGSAGWLAAWTYAYAFVFFTGTVVYALSHRVTSYAALGEQVGPLMLTHGALMVGAGTAFGVAVLRARVLPSWTAWTLMSGVVLVALTQGAHPAVGLAAAAVRDVAFAGMGCALLARRPVCSPV